MNAALAVLDPQDARPLTSREIAKLLCGVIGSLLAHDDNPAGADIVRDVVTQVIKDATNLRELDEICVGGDDAIWCSTWGAALGATVISLRGWCNPRDVQTALVWISQNLDTICSMGSDANVTPAN